MRRQAEVPLTEATDAGHEFRFDGVEDRLAVARRRAERLLRALTGPLLRRRKAPSGG